MGKAHGMDIDVFHFKQFDLKCSREVFPLTTDSVLLGSWASCQHASCVLDVGAGTGILSLMIAQRSNSVCSIFSIDDNEDAYELGKENFKRSPWSDRLHYIKQSAEEFREGSPMNTLGKSSFDVILSNPPYFRKQLLADSKVMRHAKHQRKFSFDCLAGIANRFLSTNGVLSVVLPATTEFIFTKTMMDHHLFLNRILRVKHNKSLDYSLVLLEYSRTTMMEQSEELVLFDGATVRTAEWQRLSGMFYV